MLRIPALSVGELSKLNQPEGRHPSEGGKRRSMTLHQIARAHFSSETLVASEEEIHE